MDDQLIKYFLGELNSDERLKLIRRIETDDQLKATFIRLQNIQALSQLSPRYADREEGIKKIDSFMLQIKRKSRRMFIGSLLKYAAAAVLLIASTAWITLYFQQNSLPVTTNTLYVPAGQRAHLTLQDGTEVWLNAQSTLRYPSYFSSKNREVEVTGEAFFDVAKDTKRPFIVSTQHVGIKVLGTRFNVYSYPQTGYTRASLLEGSLQVYDTEGGKANVILKPDEEVVAANGKLNISPIKYEDRFMWRDGIYSFHNERLIDIIEKLQLYYDVKIIVKEPEIFNVSYTGKFRQRDGIDEILHVIQKIQAFEISKDTENNTITLSK